MAAGVPRGARRRSAVVRVAPASLRGAHCIIEGRESAVVGARAVVLGASALVGGTLVGFVGHRPAPKPDTRRSRGALPLVRGRAGSLSAIRRQTPHSCRRRARRASGSASGAARAATAATLLPSMMQFGASPGVHGRGRPPPRHRVAACPCSAWPGRSASSAPSPTATRSASTPTTPPQWERVPGPNAVRTNAGGGAQLRLDGIDALETHYSPRGGGPLHQPIDLAHQARDELVRWLGFRGDRAHAARP